MGKSGSAGGSGKRTGGNAGTAPRPDPAHRWRSAPRPPPAAGSCPPTRRSRAAAAARPASVCTPSATASPGSARDGPGRADPEGSPRDPAVVPPRDAVHPRRGLGLKRPVGRPQAVDVNVVQERGEPRFLVRLRHSPHTMPAHLARRRSGSVSGARFAGRVPLGRSLPSTASAAPPWALFGRFAGTTGPSDFPRSCITGLRPRPSPRDPPPIRQSGTVGPPGSRAWRFTHMHRFFDPAGSDGRSRNRGHRCCLPLIHSRRHPDNVHFEAA